MNKNTEYITNFPVGRIPFEGLKNTRDLGGYEAYEGRKIAPGLLLRGEAPISITKSDEALLLEKYRLQMVIDLRTSLEAEQKPEPSLYGVTMVFNPILDEATAGFTRESKASDPFLSFLKHAQELEGKSDAYFMKLYQNMVLNRQAMERYENFLKLIAEADPAKGAILWHCSVGKDRAGMATAFLLLALGVSKETVIGDFLRTNEYLREETEKKLQKIREMGAAEATIESVATLSQVKRIYIESAFDTAEKTFGSLNTYLETKLGLTYGRKKLLRDKYLL